MQGRVLIIAGSDSGGGAGLQADIKAVSAFGAYAATAVTAVTVQNTLGVEAVHAIPSEIVRGQVRAVMSDIGADAIKVGMVHDAEIIRAVCEEIDPVHEDIPVVVDPVMVAKDGSALLDKGAMDLLKADLIWQAAVLTPNIPEAEMLTGLHISSVDDVKRAADVLLTLGCQAVLVKGGHLSSNTVSDVLMTLDETRIFSSPRIDSKHTHGTGCTLASAIAAGLAQGTPLVEAVEQARAYVQSAIRSAPGLGKGQGPLNHFPEVA